MSRLIENLYPMGGAITTCLILILWPMTWLTDEVCHNLSGVLLCTFSVVFGFAFASVGILLSISDKPFMKGTRESGAFQQLVKYHFRCMIWCICGIVSAAIIQVLPANNYHSIFNILMIATCTGITLATFRIVKLLIMLLKFMKYI